MVEPGAGQARREIRRGLVASEDVGETGWGWGGARWEWPERETTIEDL